VETHRAFCGNPQGNRSKPLKRLGFLPRPGRVYARSVRQRAAALVLARYAGDHVSFTPELLAKGEVYYNYQMTNGGMEA
jgi:hypothetical protein